MILTSGAQANLLGLGAAVVWGTADFAGGLVTRRTFPSIVVAIAHGLSLLVILAILLVAGTPIPSSQTILYGLISGAAGGIGLMLFYEGLAIGAMGLTSALTGVITTILPVFYSYFHQGRPSPTQIAGFVVAIAAIWLIAYTPGDKPHPRGLGLAVGAGIGFGLLLIFLEKAGAQSVGWALALSRVSSASIAITVSAFLLIRRKGRFSIDPSHASPRALFTRILPLAALAGALDTSGNFLYTLSALRGRIDVAAVLSSLYPGATILLAAWLLKERTTRTQALGMALALAAVVLISF
ncbi:MAG: EamA family transporter [Acidobacteriaceae bacterium]